MQRRGPESRLHDEPPPRVEYVSGEQIAQKVIGMACDCGHVVGPDEKCFSAIRVKGVTGLVIQVRCVACGKLVAVAEMVAAAN